MFQAWDPNDSKRAGSHMNLDMVARLKGQSLMRRRRWLLGTLPALFWQLTFFIGPLLIIFSLAVASKQNHSIIWTISPENFSQLVHNRSYYTALTNSVTLAALASSMSAGISYIAATGLALHFKRRVAIYFLVVAILPMFTNIYARCYAWRITLSETGPLSFLSTYLSVSPGQLLYTAYGTLLVQTLLFMPIPLIFMYSRLASLDESIFLAANNTRGTTWMLHRHVIWPELRLPLLIGFIFVWIFVLVDHITPATIGGGAPYSYPQFILDAITVDAWPSAAAAALPAFALVIGALVFATILFRRQA